jgi:PTH1 family peptidyl-tRNA hydrolase
MNKWLIAGLGNPGEKYRLTRHNIGFMVVDAVAERFNVGFKGGFESDYAVIDIFGKRCYVVKPQTYMNLSGRSIAEILGYFDILKNQIIIVHDDMDIEFGKVKIKVGGSSAGHRGVDSVISCLSFQDFIRVKMGIGKPKNIDVTGFVLSAFSKEEQSVLKEFVDLGVEAVLSILEKDVKDAMNRYNNKKICKEVKAICQV